MPRFRSAICLLSCLLILPVTAVVTEADEPSADDWHKVAVPEIWRKVPDGPLEPINGFSWYRALVKVPSDWQGQPLVLYVEALDDVRGTYLNGTYVGATGTFPPQFRSGLGESGRYEIDPDLVKFGDFNTVAIRVYQNGPRPNFNVAPPVLLNTVRSQAIRMNGQWQYRPGDDTQWAQARPTDFGINIDELPEESGLRDRGGYAAVDDVQDVDQYVTWRDGDAAPLTPAAAEQAFTVPEDLQIQLVLSEPQIAQPLFMTWDERGRMWVVEYRQYPDPAGLKMVSRDVYLRTVYDKIPEPPPHGTPGRDRITIHEDSDGDGVYDTHKTFVDGLNIATSVALGRGGAFVTNPPYLLFYPDRDGDDVPDSDPQVLLEGFGLEDSHSVINSLRFGPDGWLYGCQGSTVTGNVRRYGSSDPPVRTMGQQIWRYHPQLQRFEVFAEGGGNTFGLEIDAHGEIYSGHNGGDTRGFHYVQGGYYRKGFGKHGPLSNPYAFGYFEDIAHHSVPRFTHNFVIYEESALPESYHGRLFGIEPLQGQVVMSDIRPFQSSFETEDLSRVVQTEDQWFRPVDIKTGPDGALYIADMYEQRIDHSSHYAGRIDRSNGRIYALRSRQPIATSETSGGAVVAGSAAELTGEQLISLLKHPDKWHRQTTLRLIGDRRDAALIPSLLDQLRRESGQTALETLWALHLSGGLTSEAGAEMLQHSDPYVRAWTVRLLCDEWQVAPEISRALAQLAAAEPYLIVRKQLASSARRLPADDALPIIRQLLEYDEDAADIHQPLLVWWALEAQTHAAADREQILQTVLADADVWQRDLMQQHLLERLMKRYALAGSREELLAAAGLLKSAPDQGSAELMLNGFEDAYAGRSLAGVPAELLEALAATGGGSMALRLRQGDPQAMQQAIQDVDDPKVPKADRLQYLEIFGQIRRPEFVPVLLNVVTQETDAELVSAALTGLQAFTAENIAETIVQNFAGLPQEARPVAETLLASRPAWAVRLLQAVDAGRLPPSDLSETALRKILLHNDPVAQSLIQEHWGSVSGASTEEMQREIARLTRLLTSASGNPRAGKPVFMQNCGKCHLLFDEGGRIGPDLTSFQRDDLQRILTNVINPSLEIREGFENFVVVTTDGRVVTGFLADQDQQVVVLRGVDGQNLILPRDEIEEMQAITRSVMPEGTLKTLNDEQIRDLFAYLRSSQPVNY